jgi:hypothetical protein
MTPQEPALHQAIAAERLRLLEQLWQNIVVLRQMVVESEQLITTVRAGRTHSRVIGATHPE